jgi:hypothetical protein
VRLGGCQGLPPLQSFGLQAWGPMGGSAMPPNADLLGVVNFLSWPAGVGSYERECKTLYVNYGGAGTLPAEQVRPSAVDVQGGACRQLLRKPLPAPLRPSAATAAHCCLLQLRKIVADNFSEWGPLENVHLVPAKTLAFIRQAGMPDNRPRASACPTCGLLPPCSAAAANECTLCCR